MQKSGALTPSLDVMLIQGSPQRSPLAVCSAIHSKAATSVGNPRTEPLQPQPCRVAKRPVLAPRKPWRLSGLAAMAFATMPYSSDANQSTHMDLNFSDSGNVQLIAGERGKKKEKGDDEEEPMQAAWCTTNSSNRYSFETEILVVPSGTTLQIFSL